MAVSAKLIDSKTREKADILVNARIEPVQVPVFLYDCKPSPIDENTIERHRKYALDVVSSLKDVELYEYQTVNMISFYFDSNAEPNGDGGKESPFSNPYEVVEYIYCFLRRTCFRYNVVLNVSGNLDFSKTQNFQPRSYNFRNKLFVRGINNAQITVFRNYLHYCSFLNCHLHYVEDGGYYHRVWYLIDQCEIHNVPFRAYYIYNSILKYDVPTSDGAKLYIYPFAAVSTEFYNVNVRPWPDSRPEVFKDHSVLIFGCVLYSCTVDLHLTHDQSAEGQGGIVSDCHLEGGHIIGHFDISNMPPPSAAIPVVYKTSMHNSDSTSSRLYLYECTGFECSSSFAEKSDLIFAGRGSSYLGIWGCNVKGEVTYWGDVFTCEGPIVDSSFDFFVDDNNNCVISLREPVLYANQVEFSNNSFDVSAVIHDEYSVQRLFCNGISNLVSHNNKFNAKIKPFVSGERCYVAVDPINSIFPAIEFNVKIEPVLGVYQNVEFFMYGTPPSTNISVSYTYTVPQVQGDWRNEYVYEFSKSNGSNTSACGTIGSGHSYEFYENGSYVKHDETWDGKYHTVTTTEKEIKHDGPDGTVITTETYTEPLCD